MYQIRAFGNHNTATFGELDTRLGRRWNTDPKPNARTSVYSVFDNNPIWRTDFLLDTPSVGQAAKIAKHVYGGKDAKETNIGDWQQVSLNIPGVTWEDKKTGYASSLYARTKDGKTDYVFATRGTEDGVDWKNNFQQPLGMSRQYFLNYENARALQKYFGEKTDLTFVGHSLGGGLAAANAMATNHPAITFNAAGVGIFTRGLISKDFGNFMKNMAAPAFRKIDAYVVRGEILNMMLKPLGLGSDGNIHKIAPSIFSKYRYDITGFSDHKMDAVINALDNEGIK